MKKRICRTDITVALGLLLLSLIPLATNLKALYFNCYNTMDFVIYQQAIYDISPHNLNPFISLRNINIFNDHFDPIIYLASIFTWIFGRGFIQLLVFEWFFYAAMILSTLWIFRKEDVPLLTALPYLLCVIMTKLILYPILYPIHPTTWSSLPLFWFTYFVLKNNQVGSVCCALLLCFFRESFAFALFPLGPFYMIKRQWALGAGVLVLSLFFIIFELFGREFLLGPIADYGDSFIRSLLQNPIEFFKNILQNLRYKAFFQFFYPFIFIFSYSFIVTKEKKLLASQLLPIFLFIAPLLLLQAHKNLITAHYGAPFAGVLLGALGTLRLFDSFGPRAKVLGLLLFLASSMGTYTKSLRILAFSRFSSYEKKCQVSLEKVKSSKLVREVVASIPKDETILATVGVIPFILWPDKTIHQFRGLSGRAPSYDYLLISVNNSGNIDPAKNHHVAKLLDRCRPLAQEVIMDNEYYFFARGEFRNCAY